MDELQSKILGYQPAADIKKILRSIQILFLVGPTSSGKDTLVQELIKTAKFRPIISYATRAPRLNHGVMEKDGDEYHFVSDKQAIKMLKEQSFIEAAYTHNHMYATAVNEFIRAKEESKIPVTDLDIKGVKSYRQLSDKVTAVFLLPPSFQILISRLTNRYGTSRDQEDIKIRLATALDELYELLNTDYYYVIINKDIAITTNRVLDIVAGKVALKPDLSALKLAQILIDDIKEYLLKF